jgi:hypothetical protein
LEVDDGGVGTECEALEGGFESSGKADWGAWWFSLAKVDRRFGFWFARAGPSEISAPNSLEGPEEDVLLHDGDVGALFHCCRMELCSLP